MIEYNETSSLNIFLNLVISLQGILQRLIKHERAYRIKWVFFYLFFFLFMIDIKLQDYTKNKKDKTKTRHGLLVRQVR